MNSSGDEEQLGSGTRQASFPFSPMDSSTDAASSDSSSSPLPSLSQHQQAAMDACREFYERRLQTLERFRHRVTSCQQPDVETPREQAHDSVQYHRLQSDMIELMENDVSLMRQLMSLGERIEELKALAVFGYSSSVSPSSSPNGISPISSTISLDGVCCEDDIENNNEAHVETVVAERTKSGTVLKMDNGNDDETESGVDGDENEVHSEGLTVVAVSDSISSPSPRRVYFSRQNSILRIPIPPSRGLRSKTVADLQPHDIPAGVISIIKRGHSTACEPSSNEDNSSSGSSRGAGWYARMKAGRDLIKSGSILSKKQSRRNEGSDGDGRSSASISPPYHASQSSCDSGVHHMNSSVDLLDGEELIYV